MSASVLQRRMHMVGLLGRCQEGALVQAASVTKMGSAQAVVAAGQQMHHVLARPDGLLQAAPGCLASTWVGDSACHLTAKQRTSCNTWTT